MVGGMDKLRAKLTLGVALIVIAVVACNNGQPQQSLAANGAGVKVDSILPAGETLDRFFNGAERPQRLRGAPSPDSLIRAALTAVEKRDTSELRELVVTREEYASLYYPGSIYAREPYSLPPEIAWMLNSENSGKGERRLMQRLGGQRIELIGWKCQKDFVEAGNRFLTDCVATHRVDGGAVRSLRLFAAIMERNDESKFLSLAGDF